MAEGNNPTMEERRAMHETLTWLEAWRNANTARHFRVRLTSHMRQLQALVPDDLCLHLDACPNYTHTPEQVKL